MYSPVCACIASQTGFCTPCTIRITQGSSPILDQAPDNGDCLVKFFLVPQCIPVSEHPGIWLRGLFLTGSLLKKCPVPFEPWLLLLGIFLDEPDEGDEGVQHDRVGPKGDIYLDPFRSLITSASSKMYSPASGLFCSSVIVVCVI